MTLSRASVALIAAAFLLPFLVFAQSDDALRAKIRADIMSDPRSSEMSPAEIDAMVDALAGQAEEEGVAADYLDSQNSFEPIAPPIYQEPAATWDPLAIALLSLFVVLAGVATFLIWHRKKKIMLPENGA
ncbi:MAG: hypothetical protein WAZ27_02515 [Minisyncoccia bacterium]